MKRLGRYRLIGMAIVGAIAVGLIARAEYLNFNDYCYSEGRYPGDQSLIDAAIRYEIDHVPASYFSQGGKKYTSVDEFRQANPICCFLEKWGDHQRENLGSPRANLGAQNCWGGNLRRRSLVPL